MDLAKPTDIPCKFDVAYSFMFLRYELCNIYGLHLVDEANMETHGFDAVFQDNEMHPACRYVCMFLCVYDQVFQDNEMHPACRCVCDICVLVCGCLFVCTLKCISQCAHISRKKTTIHVLHLPTDACHDTQVQGGLWLGLASTVYMHRI
jgi:hypothetical protein